jgi:MFS family permease
MRLKVNVDGNWRSFRHRNFRIFFWASTLANIGNWAQRVAQDWLVLELTNNNGTYLGLVTAVQFAPVLFFSLYGGKIADRFNKRRVLVLTNIVGGVTSLTLGLLAITNNAELWHVFVLAGILGISTAIEAPVRQVFVTEVVGPVDLPNAVALTSANFNAGRLIGPALSGILIALFGTGASFLVNATSYVFIVVALYRLNETAFFHQEIEKTLGGIRQGIAYVRARPDIYVVMLLIFFLATFGLNLQIFNALMATKEFGLGPASFGIMGTVLAVGSLSGALGAARLERFRDTKFIIKVGMAFSICVMILSILPTFAIYLFWLPFCGLTALITLVSANSIVQTSSDPVIRGRVMGLYLLVFMGGTPFGAPLIGLSSELLGIRLTIAICGLISLLASVLVWWIYRNRVTRPADISVAAVLKSVNRNQD